jgi:hypothetical protein
MRIECPRSLVAENCADDISSAPIFETAGTPNSSRRELLQFDNSRCDCAIVGTRDPLVCSDQREDGDIFGRRDREVVKHSSIGRFPIVTLFVERTSRRLSPLGQQFAGLRVKIFAKIQELIPLHTSAKSEHFRTFADPLPGNLLPFAVVVTNAKVLLEVFLRIL